MEKPSFAYLLSTLMPPDGSALAIGNKSDSAGMTFEIGKTDKRTVIEALGLPADVRTSEALGREYWAYCARPAPTMGCSFWW